MGLQDRDYMRDVPIYRRLVGREAPAAGGGGAGGRRPPTTYADPPNEPSWWGSTKRARRRSGTRPWAWFLLGVVATLAVVGYVAERGVPMIGGRTVEMAPLVIPAPAGTPRPPIAMEGPENLKTGTVVAVEGTMSAQQGRIVEVRVRWNGGPWQGLRAVEAAEDGSFRIEYALDRPGTAQVRLVFPDGTFAYKWYRLRGPPRAAPSPSASPSVAGPAPNGSVQPPMPAATPPIGGRWPDGRIPYFNAAPEHEWALQQAVAAWNASGASVQFEPAAEEDAKVVITARGDQPCGHGRAPLGYTPKSTVVVFRMAGTSCDPFTAARVLAHELGHVLGLQHDEGTCALMNAAGNHAGPRQCAEGRRWAWRCRLIEPADALRAVQLYGGTPAAARSPATCPLYAAMDPPHGLRLVDAPASDTHLVITFGRPPDAVLPSFLLPGGEAAFAYAYTHGSACAERPTSARYRWNVPPGQEQTVVEPILGSGVHCFRVWALDQLGRPSTGASTLEIDVQR